MRIPGWILGVTSFLILFGATALCSFLVFTSSQQVVADLWDRGVEVEGADAVVEGVSSFIQVVTGNTLPTATSEPAPTDVSTQVVLAPSSTPAEGVADDPSTLSTATPDDSQALLPTVTTTPPKKTFSIDFAPDATATEFVAPTEEVIDIPTWDDPRQVRILLLGIDQRSATGDTGPFRTDTMMVASVDPVRNTVGLISFPRDLWVNIPNFESARINTAHFIGDVNGYPGGGGPALAMETISANFGIPVDRYISINFDVFTAIANTLAPNGVEVCVEEYIYDPDYPDDFYGTIEVEFLPGCQRMDAETLLQYARNRATEGGDFDRAQRQQQVLNAMFDELLSVGGVTNFITQAPTLWDQLSSGYRTNLTFDEIIRLAGEITEIDSDDIHTAVIDNLYVEFGTSPDGTQQVLIPIQSQIGGLIQRVFYPGEEVDEATLRSRSELEDASIVVYNGTDIAGLAGLTQEWLISRGVSVTAIGNDTNHGGQPTVIKDYTNNPQTAQFLASLLGLPPERIQPGADGLTLEDIMIVVGPDIESIIGGQ